MHEWVPVTITLLLSTAITMAATAAIMLAVSRLPGREGSEMTEPDLAVIRVYCRSRLYPTCR